MIRFALRCEHAHEFEAWFGSNADFDMQRERGLVSCPFCESAAVEKALMTPRVTTGETREARQEAVAKGLTNLQDAAMREKMRELARHVRENTTDVGTRFPEEARRIHYGEVEERAIRGVAKPDEARALVEEGVTIAPVPLAPDEAN